MILSSKKWIVNLLVIIPIISFSQNTKTLSIQPDSGDGKDAWVWSGERTKEANFGIEQPYNQGLHNVIRAEVWKWFGQEESDTIRSFLSFDLSEIPQTAIVLEARLSLFFYANDGFTPQLGENNLKIEMVSEEWDEAEINWVNQPTVRTEFSLFLRKSEVRDQDYVDIDIRPMVQEMVYFPNQNYGMRLALVNELPYTGLTFASSDHEDPKLRPVLSVEYQVNE